MDERLTVYLGARGYTPDLITELGQGGVRIRSAEERLVITEGPPVEAAWAQNVWTQCSVHPVATVGEAVKILRGMQRNWAKYSIRAHRRAELIQARLPRLSHRPHRFGDPRPASPMGSWTLLDPGRLLASPVCTSPFPNGEVYFDEDRTGPPSRAYLKLWELFTVRDFRPRSGEHCLDLGSSPGGWTWVLSRLGCRVTSVDKAPLDARASGMAGVTHLRTSAFSLDPGDVEGVDWLFCDVICYPRRLLALVRKWLESGRCRNMVCTLKFQGRTDHDVVRDFAALPGSRLAHLWHNQHELTWWRVMEGVGPD